MLRLHPQMPTHDMALRTVLNGLALCAGAGGLELGLRLALGARYRCVGYVEQEAFAAACLVARMEEEALDPGPLWDDVRTFDGRPWRGVVDLVTAGFPCQPWSSGGRRRGIADERWIWPDIARVVSEVNPNIVFLENVPGIRRGGESAVLSDLGSLGFQTVTDCFRASDVGAPMRRTRWFCLAYAKGHGHARIARSVLQAQEEVTARWDDARDRGGDLVAWPPRPHDFAGWSAWISANGPLPALRRGSDGLAKEVGRSARLDQLRVIGNGVCPSQAAHAFALLSRRFH